MHPHPLPLNPAARNSLQHWLGETDANTLRKLARAKIILAQCSSVTHIMAAVDDDQFVKDALNAAEKAKFWEQFLLELGAMQAGKYEGTNEEFEYVEITAITDQASLGT